MPLRRIMAVAVGALVLALLPAVAGSAPVGPSVGSISGVVSNVDYNDDTFVSADPVGAVLPAVGRYDVDTIGTSGTYDMDNLKPGDYRVRIFTENGTRAWEWHPGTRDSSKATIFRVKAGQSITNVDLGLDEGGHIAGAVSFPPGTDLHASNAYVTAYYLDGAVWKPVPSDSAKAYLRLWSTFRIGGLATGTYRLKYESAGGTGGTSSGFLGGTDEAAMSTPVQVVAGQTQTANITPRMGGVLRGRVVDPDGQPVAGVTITALKPGPSGEHWVTGTSPVMTDADGRYQLTPLDSGDYALRFGAYLHTVWSGGAVASPTVLYPWSNMPPSGTQPVHVDAGRVSTWKDETIQSPGTLEGTVRDQHGEPVEGVEVSTRRIWGYMFANPMTVDGPVVRTTDAEGRYDFGEMPSAAHMLTFTDPLNAYSLPVYLTDEYSGGDPYKSFDGVIITAGKRKVVDIQARAYPPTVSDPTPVVGQAVAGSLTLGGTSVASDPDAVWTWRRNGRVIPGADEPSYRTTTADRGARLTTEVTTVREGRPALHTSKSTSSVAISRPSISLSASSTGKGRVRLTIKAYAKSVTRSLVDGRVSIARARRGSDHLVTRSMRDGTLVVTLTGQPKGRRTYSVKFLGATNRYTASSTLSRSVKVR